MENILRYIQNKMRGMNKARLKHIIERLNKVTEEDYEELREQF